MPDGFPALTQLTETIRSRKQQPSSSSYTSSLLQTGMKAIGAKVMEEASEFVTAAHDLDEPHVGETDKRKVHLVHEAADLLYHTMVMLAYFDADLTDVDHELARRFGTSGFAEKAARKKT